MSDVHLLVLIHGMWGQPSHVSELKRIILEKYPLPEDSNGARISVLLAETNRENSTYDGIDWGGERIAQEITEEVHKLESEGQKVTKLSVTGYSLGGLLARYVIGILSQRGFFDTVQPMNFNTIATPHIGLPKFPHLLSSLMANLAPTLLSRTGEQFYCVDKWSVDGRPLLDVMADPDQLFYQALTRFPNICIYANSINDVTVNYMTACIETEDPFEHHETNGLEIEMDPEYPQLIKSWHLPPTPPPPPPKPLILTPSWFNDKRKPRRPFFPPGMQLRFPFNIFLYLAFPFILPMFLTLALIRTSIAARRSRKRIRLLETDESHANSLVHAFNRLEKQLQDAVADFVDESQLQATPVSGGSSPTVSVPPSAAEEETSENVEVVVADKKKAHQPLSALQLQMAAHLNQLPGLRKERAYFPYLRNSHATIVCRDVKRFEGHKLGESVLRHWADRFLI